MIRILSLVVAILIGHMGLKIYLHERIAAEINKMMAFAHPFFEIDYQDISTSFLEKSISVKGIEVTPQSASPIKISSLTLYGADMFGTTQEWFNQVDLEQPLHQGIKIKGLVMPIDDAIAYSSFASNPEQVISFQDIKAMGYDMVDMDLSFTLRTFPESKYIELHYQQFHRNMFKLEMHATLAAKSFDFNQLNPMISPNAIQLVSASVTFEDDSIMEKVQMREAKKKKMTLDGLKDELMQSFKKLLVKNQVEIAEDQMRAINNFIYDYQPITVSIKPKHPIGFNSFNHMHLYKTSDVKNMLNVNITN